VIVVEENHGYSEIVGNPNAPFMNRLIDDGASFTQFFAETHPSQPNYLALFSGSRQGLTDDSCPNRFEGANLATQLAQAGRRFAGYADSLPSVGFSGCRSGPYVRRHLPWTNFPAVPATATLPATSFPSDLTTLPSVSFVIPDLNHDMHDGTIAEADVWLEQKLSAYVTWARTHNSLLIVTWDEGPKTGPNRIPTFIDGAHVRAGHYNSHLDHYDLLRTIEALESLPPIGQAASAQVIRDIWTG
jgi:acid phosphatase